MASLDSIKINDTGFIRTTAGTLAERSGTTAASLRYNSTIQRHEHYNGTTWKTPLLSGLGSSASDPAKSGYHLAQTRPGLASGLYWIKSDMMPNALQMYVDMTEEGGGFDFYPITGGTSVNFISPTATHSGLVLGLDLVYPRSKYHWRAMHNYVRGVLGSAGNDFFATVYAVTRETGAGAGSSGGNYTSQIMRDARYYGSGTFDWKVPDGGRWWIRDTAFGEPNGDYGANGFLGGYGMPNPYTLTDLGFNDISANYPTGGSYLVSTNAKP